MKSRVRTERVIDTLRAWRRALREVGRAERTLAGSTGGASEDDARAVLDRAREAEAEAAERHRTVQALVYERYADDERESARRSRSQGDPAEPMSEAVAD